MGRKTLATALLVAALVASCDRGERARRSEPHPQLQRIVDSGNPPAIITTAGASRGEASHLFKQVQSFYKQTGYRLIWVDGDHPSSRYEQLAGAIDAAWRQGLDPRRYDVTNPPGFPVQASERSAFVVPEDRAAEFDLWVTFTLFRYGSHLTGGQLDPHEFESQWTLRPERMNLVNALAQAVTTDDLPQAIERLAPKHPEYVALQRALERYRAIQDKGGWPAVPRIKGLKEGQSDPAVPALRQRLTVTGELDASQQQHTSPVFDRALADAVRRFEDRHRLEPDGLVDPEVITAMNVPVDARVRQIVLNMERWRWLPDTMPARYIRVIVPDYRLEIIESAQPVMDIRVVVGKPEQPTPIFADQMTHVIFSPSWHIPPSIARNETIPQAARDPGFLTRNNIEVVQGSGSSARVVDPASIDWSLPEGQFSFRQRPGPGNSLGQVKFMFPNNFNVYLHDTPADHLFFRPDRGFSHGCVRVEEPLALAEYVLRDQPEWTRDKIIEAMRAGRERQVSLKTPLPVFIVYLTAWADSHGTVRFLEDLYGHDAKQLARLANAAL